MEKVMLSFDEDVQSSQGHNGCPDFTNLPDGTPVRRPSSGTCFGDSGGPNFIGSTHTIAGS